jgi:hypothetical protein
MFAGDELGIVHEREDVDAANGRAHGLIFAEKMALKWKFFCIILLRSASTNIDV